MGLGSLGFSSTISTNSVINPNEFVVAVCCADKVPTVATYSSRAEFLDLSKYGLVFVPSKKDLA